MAVFKNLVLTTILAGRASHALIISQQTPSVTGTITATDSTTVTLDMLSSTYSIAYMSTSFAYDPISESTDSLSVLPSVLSTTGTQISQGEPPTIISARSSQVTYRLSASATVVKPLIAASVVGKPTGPLWPNSTFRQSSKTLRSLFGRIEGTAYSRPGAESPASMSNREFNAELPKPRLGIDRVKGWDVWQRQSEQRAG